MNSHDEYRFRRSLHYLHSYDKRCNIPLPPMNGGTPL